VPVAPRPRVIPPPTKLAKLGPLVVVDGDCAYFPDSKRASRTVYALPGLLRPAEYRVAMSLGMRRSGTLVYRPVCAGCRRCQPFRIAVDRFEPSRSQRRVQKRCDGLFHVELNRPVVDDEHLQLYRRYQEDQHDKDGQETDEESYARFLVETVVDTWELSWRDRQDRLVAVGIVDVVDDGVSTVYFYWDPSLRDLSLGVYSALWEIDLTKRWGKQYYYLGYLVGGAVTMSYKAQFSGGEIWDGDAWVPVPSRDLADPAMQAVMTVAEESATRADDVHFAGALPTDG
jgi:arginyl-tRNA--protein-N-Asp/Glu arginylyltransferase